MFCPSCGRENQEGILFCGFCGKALPQKSQAAPTLQPGTQPPPGLQRTSIPEPRLPYNAKKGIITILLIAAIIIVILVIFYPNLLPWNW